MKDKIKDVEHIEYLAKGHRACCLQESTKKEGCNKNKES